MQSSVLSGGLTDSPFGSEFTILTRAFINSSKLPSIDQFHVGSSARFRRKTKSSRAFEYKFARSSSFGARASEIIGTSDNDFAIFLEAFAQKDGFNVTAEATGLNAQGQRVWGGTIDAEWIVGGRKNYDPKRGRILAPTIFQPIDSGGLGAAEFSLRFDVAAIDDYRDRTSHQYSMSAGFKWRLNDQYSAQFLSDRTWLELGRDPHVADSIKLRLLARF